MRLHNTEKEDFTDCRTKEGEAVSLIDSINILLQALYSRRSQFGKQSVKNAIKDLQNNEEAWFSITKISLTEKDIQNNVNRIVRVLLQENKENNTKIEI